MAITGQGSVCLYKTALSANDSTAKEQLGSLRYEYDSTNGDKVYMYVLASGNIASGDMLTWKGITGYTVGVQTTSVISRNPLVAVGQSTISDTKYGWVQVRGYHSAVKAHSKYNQTAYCQGFLLSGFFRGKPDGDSYEVPLSANGASFCPFTPFVSGASACTTVAGYVNCM